jgi:hypothetical protein
MISPYRVQLAGRAFEMIYWGIESEATISHPTRATLPEL